MAVGTGPVTGTPRAAQPPPASSEVALPCHGIILEHEPAER